MQQIPNTTKTRHNGDTMYVQRGVYKDQCKTTTELWIKSGPRWAADPGWPPASRAPIPRAPSDTTIATRHRTVSTTARCCPAPPPPPPRRFHPEPQILGLPVRLRDILVKGLDLAEWAFGLLYGKVVRLYE